MAPVTDIFFGRERQLREIVQGVLAPQPASFSVVGTKYVGKTRLLHYLASEEGPLLNEEMADWRSPRFRDESRIVVASIDCDWPEAQQDLLAFMAEHLRKGVEAERINLDWDAVSGQSSKGRRIWQIARQLSQLGYRLVLVMDNLDRVFENQLIQQDTSDELRPLTMEMALVVATQQPLHDLDRDLAASPLFNVMSQIFLGLVDADAARTWIGAYAEQYPGIVDMTDLLLKLTGSHPFLLDRIGDIISEVSQFLPPDQQIDNTHSELFRLRLAEHGRLLFTTQWRKLQAPPPRIAEAAVQALLARLLNGHLKAADVQRDYFAALNWLINQAVVAFGSQGYQIYSPLFVEYLAAQMGESIAAETAMMPAVESVPDLPIYQQLTKTEVSLLRYFQIHSRTIVSPEQLLADVWQRPDASPRRVQEAIRRLRLQLAEADPPVGDIENERGRGYRFIPTGR